MTAMCLYIRRGAPKIEARLLDGRRQLIRGTALVDEWGMHELQIVKAARQAREFDMEDMARILTHVALNPQATNRQIREDVRRNWSGDWQVGVVRT